MTLTWKIQALDGAGPEGTTLYVLYDPLWHIVGTAEWPQPLEALAAESCYPCVRLPALLGQSRVEVDDD